MTNQPDFPLDPNNLPDGPSEYDPTDSETKDRNRYHGKVPQDEEDQTR